MRNRTAVIADVHLGSPKRLGGPVYCGINRRGQLVLDAFTEAVDRARAAPGLVICGDLFDTTKPTPQLIRYAQDVLDIEPAQLKVILAGNHDQISTLRLDNALAPLGRGSSTYIVDHTIDMFAKPHPLTVVPFRPGPVRKWLWDALEAAHNSRMEGSLLCLHMGISDDETPAYLRDVDGQIFIDDLVDIVEWFGFAGACAGDWHERRGWYDWKIIQVGALAPTGWNNPGVDDYGWMAWWDGKRFECEHVPGPRFIRVAPTERQVWQRLNPIDGCTYFVELDVLEDEDAIELREYWSEFDWVDTLTMRVVRPGASEQARIAAQSARSMSTLQEALTAYVREMPLKNINVSRDVILNRAAHYLK